IGKQCGECEFTCPNDSEFKNGFKECWKAALGWSDKDFGDPNVLEVWDFRVKDKFIKEGRIKLVDLMEDDFSPETDGQPGISSKQRKWLQVEKVQKNDMTPFFDRDGLALEMTKWKFPLHFIDF